MFVSFAGSIEILMSVSMSSRLGDEEMKHYTFDKPIYHLAKSCEKKMEFKKF